MRSGGKPRSGALSRRLREIWPDANPLRRRSDRAEAKLLGALCAIFLVCAPVLTFLAGGYVYQSAVRAQHSSYQVTAVLQSNARPLADNARKAAATATWTAPNGSAQRGSVFVPVGARARSRLRIWVDTAGQLTGMPLRGPVLAADVAVAAVLTSAGLGSVLGGIAATARWMLHRRRLAAWDAAWQSIEPQWLTGN